MKQHTILSTIMIISTIGIVFSGFLSYRELFTPGCTDAYVQCSSEFTLLTLPACVYGLFMYTALFIISVVGLRNNNN